MLVGSLGADFYVQWCWEAGRLTVTSSPFGFAPVYYSVSGNSIIVATSIDELLCEGASSATDYPALATFLRLGFYLGTDTPFEAIKAIPCSGQIEWTPTHGLIEVPGRLNPQPNSITREQAREAYAATFRNAVSKRTSANSRALPLSGGRDSRHILFELCSNGNPPAFCITAEHHPPPE
jgi:asparagine synthase (glutamine-hydrolysing)